MRSLGLRSIKPRFNAFHIYSNGFLVYLKTYYKIWINFLTKELPLYFKINAFRYLDKELLLVHSTSIASLGQVAYFKKENPEVFCLRSSYLSMYILVWIVKLSVEFDTMWLFSFYFLMLTTCGVLFLGSQHLRRSGFSLRFQKMKQYFWWMVTCHWELKKKEVFSKRWEVLYSKIKKGGSPKKGIAL